jgi:anti-sigma B factor antagonist
MKSEALDISLHSRRGAIWLDLAGPFHSEQVPSMKEKITEIVKDGNRHIVIDMERISEIDDAAVQLFLNLLNMIKEKGGDLRLVFKNAVVSKAFSGYRNLFSIYPTPQALDAGGFLNTLRFRGILLSHKTGVRLSRPVALFVLFVLLCLFLSLGFIINMQYKRIRQQEEALQELTVWQQQAHEEIRYLVERLRPMEQLGILRDTLLVPDE